MTHHPHVHMIVPGGGISLDGTRWVRCKPGFLLPVRVLSRLFRRLFLAGLADAHAAGRLAFFGEIEGLQRRDGLRRASRAAAAEELVRLRQAALRRARGGARLSRPLHPPRRHREQPARRLDERGVTFRYKDYRRNGQARYRTMTLAADEFIRRFLLHVLPKGFHRIRHYGLLASAGARPISRAPGS